MGVPNVCHVLELDCKFIWDLDMRVTSLETIAWKEEPFEFLMII